MSKIVVPSDIHGKELFAFLVANKNAIINERKQFMKICDPMGWGAHAYLPNEKGIAVKNDMSAIPPDATAINVKVVANTSLWMDSQGDVLLRDSAQKSINDRLPKGQIKMLKDHGRTLDSEIADVKNVYYQDMALTDLGINKSGSAQVLVFDANVQQSYDPKTFNKYKSGKVNQHSIGLQYVKLELAVNDPDYEKEQDFWNKYIGQVINQDEATAQGYFWVVPEYKLIENSAVLFGANSITPTLSTSEAKRNTVSEPVKTTFDQPSEIDFDWINALKGERFF